MYANIRFQFIEEELIVAVLQKRDRELRDSIATTVAAAGRSPTRRLLAVFDWLENWFGSHDFKGCVFIRALSEYPEPDHAIHRVAWAHKLAVQKMLADLCAEAGAKNPTDLGETLSLLIDGAIVAAHGSSGTEPTAAARTTAASLLKLATG